MVFSNSFKAYACYSLALTCHIVPIFGKYVRTHDTTGCSKPHTVDGVSRNYSLLTNGGKRDYRLHIPSSYDPNTPAPLIISYHGHGKNMVEQETLSQFSNDAINPNMIAVYPQGLEGAGGKRSWEGEFNPAPGVNDKLFTSDLINDLEANYCIDTSSIYANGMSDGGGFVNTLACSPNGATFAAFAPVSGAFYTDTKYSDCSPSRIPLPVLEFHGYADSTVNYTGGPGNGGPLPSIPEWLSWWAQRDGCKDPVADKTTTAQSGYEYITYSCEGVADVVRHYKILDLGHKWPNTSITVSPINASPIIMDFFDANHKSSDQKFKLQRC